MVGQDSILQAGFVTGLSGWAEHATSAVWKSARNLKSCPTIVSDIRHPCAS